MNHLIHEPEPLEKQIFNVLATRFEYKYNIRIEDRNLLWTEFMLYLGQVHRVKGSMLVMDYCLDEDYLRQCERTGKRNFVTDFRHTAARNGITTLSNKRINLIYPLTVFFECMVGQYAYTPEGWFDYDHRHGQDMDLVIPEPVKTEEMLDLARIESGKEKRRRLERLKQELKKTETIV